MYKISGLTLEVVVLKCPYLNLDDPAVRDLFTKMIFLKFKGYGNNHELGSLPLDSTDYVADHPLICVRDQNGLRPISGSKVISYETCQRFNLDFAMESCFKKNGLITHTEVLNSIIEGSKRRGKTVAYHGGYTMDPLVRHKLEDKALIKEIFIGSTMNYFCESGITELLGLGVPKFKTDDFFYQWGYQRCTLENLDLRSFPLHFLPGTEGVMMHLKKYSQHVLELRTKYKSLWDNRTELGQSAKSFFHKDQAA